MSAASARVIRLRFTGGEARDLHPFQPMRAIAALTAFGAIAASASSVFGQDRMTERLSHEVRRGVPVVTVASSIGAPLTDDDAAAAARRFADEWSARLRPIEERLHQDVRLRRAGAIVGLSAAAIGALRGQPALTFVGTQAVRIGLDRQLTAIRARSGFEIQPTIGHRSFAVTVNRNFDK